MSNLVEHAKRELEIIGAFDKDKDFYGGMTGDAVLELIEVFAKQGHSGMSASIVRNFFNKLADFKPLAPLTFKDGEWGAVDNTGMCQNKRNSAVFKNCDDGKPYYIYAYYKKDQKGGTWSGNLNVGDGKHIGRCYIKDPANMPSVCIDIIEWEVNKEDESIKEPGSGWWVHKMKDPKQLEELKTASEESSTKLEEASKAHDETKEELKEAKAEIEKLGKIAVVKSVDSGEGTPAVEEPLACKANELPVLRR